MLFQHRNCMTNQANNDSHVQTWQNYNTNRVKEGIVWGFVFAAIALVWGLAVLDNRPSEITIGLRQSDVEDSNANLPEEAASASNVSIPEEVVRDEPCPSGQSCDAPSVYSFLIRSFTKMLRDVVVQPEEMTVSWYFRWLTFIIIFCSIPVFYRVHLSERHQLVYDSRQAKLTEKIRWTYIINKFEIVPDDNRSKSSLWAKVLGGFDWLLSKVGLILTMVTPILLIPFATYIVTSMASRALELMFVDVVLTWQQVLIMGVLFAFLFAYLSVQILTIVDTYELFFIAGIVIGLGFAWGFSVAETIPATNGGDCERWYCHSISTTGIQTSSGIIFTMTMLAIGYFLLLIWHDVSTYLKFVLQNKKHVVTPQIQNRKTEGLLQTLTKWDTNWHWTYRLLVIGFLCLIGVGIFPTINTEDIPLNVIHFWAAMIGTGLLLFAGKLWLTCIVLRDILPAHYRNTTLILLILDCLLIIYYYFIQQYVKIIPLNFTGLELYLLISIGVWFAGLAENVLRIINQLEYVYNENKTIQDNGELAVDVPQKMPWHIVVQTMFLKLIQIPIKYF